MTVIKFVDCPEVLGPMVNSSAFVKSAAKSPVDHKWETTTKKIMCFVNFHWHQCFIAFIFSSQLICTRSSCRLNIVVSIVCGV